MNRLKRAISELRGKPVKDNPVVASTVRPSESHGYGANRTTTFAEFVRMAVKWTAIAVDRNGNGVASTPLRVMRKAKGGTYAGSWRTKSVPRWKLADLQYRSDSIARKALGDSEELEEVTDEAHPLVRLINRPNPWQSVFDFLYDQVAYLDLTGNAISAHVPGPSSPVYELWTLPSQHVRAIPDPVEFIRAYVYGRGREIEREFLPADITHVKFASPTDPYMGRGCVAGYYGDGQLSMAFTDINLAMLDNGASPSLVFEAPNSTPAQRSEIEEKIRQRWTGVRNAFSAIVTGGDLKVVPNAARGFTEMPFMMSDDACASLIANAHGIPPALLKLDTAALATAQAAMPHWQKMALLPRCKRISEAFNRSFVEKFREALNDPSLCVVFDNPVDKDEAAEVLKITQLVDKVLTKNECRGILGYEPVEGGDEFTDPVDPFAMQPPTSDNQDATDGESGATDGTDAEDDGEEVQATKRAKTIADAWFDGSCCHTETRPRTKKVGERYIELTERQLEKLFSDYFRGASALIVDGVNGTGTATVELSRLTDYNVRAAKATEPVFRDLYVNGYNGGASEVNDHRPDTLELITAMNEAAANLLDGFQSHLYRTVSATVDGKVRAALARVMLDGGGLDEMRAAVQGVMVNAETYAAERIAATESARAYGMARRQAWKDSGIVVGEEWLLSGNPCEACRELHARRRIVRSGQPFARIGETFGTFTVGYADVLSDPLHPNCRCGTAAIFDDDPAAVGLKQPAQVSEEAGAMAGVGA